VAIELGRELAERARQRLSAFPAVEVVNADFEEWRAEDGSFDAAVSFAALHWVDPDVRYTKTAQLLKPGGALAVFNWSDTLSENGDGFFEEVVEDYEVVVPECRHAHRSLPLK
jgi:trans-aconitate methyltransferase